MSVKEMCESLQSTVGKQMPPKVKQGCPGTWIPRYQEKQVSQERWGEEPLRRA